MKRIGIVVQRYGLEVNGGAELLCRQIAERLSAFFDVEVLTTKALNYVTWANDYEKDTEMIDGIFVRRFPVAHERLINRFDYFNQYVHDRNLPKNLEDRWLEEQGPYVPQMIDYIREHKDDFDAFIVFTYLYYPSVMAIKEVGRKALLFSFAHDEPYIYLNVFRELFDSPAAIAFSTKEEMVFVRKTFHNYQIPSYIGGAGVDVPDNIDPEGFKAKYGLADYFIYVGRIDIDKNCDELFSFFLKYKENNPGDLKLVLMGKTSMDIPESEDIINLGFVSDEDKFNGIAGSKALINPSSHESLSIVLLEAFSLKIPVVVTGKCEVLKGHCDNSNAGIVYDSYDEFEKALKLLGSDKEFNNSMGESGYAYVKQHYGWGNIISNTVNAINKIIDNGDNE